MANVFKIAGRNGKKLACFHGKVKIGPGAWKRVALLSDKQASERRLRELQSQADRRRVGLPVGDLERLSRPIGDLVEQYVASMRVRKLDSEHVRISDWLLRRMVQLGKWRTFADVTVRSVEDVLRQLDNDGATAGYQNKFVKRARAFARWAVSDGVGPDPLRGLHQVREKGSLRRRERRAASAEQVHALFAIQLPDYRRLAYALAAFNGLRRNEIARDDHRRLRWHQIHLDAPIPFVTLGQKQASDDATDEVPLHPYVIQLLKAAGPGLPQAPVVSAVPDVRTLAGDWAAAGVPFTDERGRRLDFHALRHTFETSLDRAQVSRATKKKLMRHADDDITDGYTHAELAEMRAALDRVPSPRCIGEPATRAAVEPSATTLKTVIDRWPSLPPPVRQAIGMLIQAFTPGIEVQNPVHAMA